jgi:hypothetical protein
MATINATAAHHSSVAGCAPNFQPHAANSSAVDNSTSGYRLEMAVPHDEQRPFRRSQPISGRFSCQRSTWPQLGQRERGRAKLMGLNAPNASAMALADWLNTAGGAPFCPLTRCQAAASPS